MLDLLDTATLFAGNAIAAIAALMAMLLLWRIHPKEIAIPLWALGFATQTIATMLYSQRAELPMLLVVLGGNALGIGCSGLLYAGIAKFTRRPIAWRTMLLTYLTGAGMILHGTFVQESVLARTLAYSLSVVIVTLLAVYLLWTSGDGQQKPILRLVAGSSMVVAIITTYRALAVASASVDLLPPMNAVTAGTAWLLVTQVNIFITAFGFLLMSSQRLQQRLDELASRDDLTVALNRRAFHAQADGLHGGSVFLALDLDHFKQVNDRHGHATGDAVLRHVTAKMQSLLCKQDLLARAGGEEFWILLPGLDEQAGGQTAERLREAIEREPVATDGTSLQVTVSIGLACVQAGTGITTLAKAISAGDKALYRAKAQGRNRVVVAQE